MEVSNESKKIAEEGAWYVENDGKSKNGMK